MSLQSYIADARGMSMEMWVFFFCFFFSDCSKQVRVLQRDLILFFFQIFNTKSTSQKAFASTCHA